MHVRCTLLCISHALYLSKFVCFIVFPSTVFFRHKNVKLLEPSVLCFCLFVRHFVSLNASCLQHESLKGPSHTDFFVMVKLELPSWLKILHRAEPQSPADSETQRTKINVGAHCVVVVEDKSGMKLSGLFWRLWVCVSGCISSGVNLDSVHLHLPATLLDKSQ